MSTLRHEQFVDQFQVMARTGRSDDEPAARLARIGAFARRAVAADAAGFTVATPDHRFNTVGETDRLVIAVDAMQGQLHEGPWLDLTTGDSNPFVQCDDLLSEGRWPRWSPLAAQLGFRSLLSIVVPHTATGYPTTFTIYARQVRRFGQQDLATIRVFTADADAAVRELTRH